MDALVETLHVTLEPDYSNDFYYVLVEISVADIDGGVRPPSPRSPSPVQPAPAGRRADADNRERLPKAEQHLIPPWTDAEGGGDDEGGEEPDVGASESESVSKGRSFKLFRFFAKRWRK